MRLIEPGLESSRSLAYDSHHTSPFMVSNLVETYSQLFWVAKAFDLSAVYNGRRWLTISQSVVQLKNAEQRKVLYRIASQHGASLGGAV